MEILDKKDENLLELLYLDSRMSNSQLAKKLAVSKDTVNNKIKKFLEKEIISAFTCKVNLEKLGFNTFTVLFKFNEDLSKNAEISDYFKNHPFCMWAVTISGEYDILAEFIAEGFFSMEKIILQIREHFGERLNFYELDIFAKMVRIDHLIKDLNKNNLENGKSFSKRDIKNIKLDQLDKKIIYELAKYSNISLIELAERVDSTWDVVRYRMKSLENNLIIRKYHPMLNYKKLGYMPFIGKITFQNISKLGFDAVEDLIKNNENITYAFTSANSLSIVFNCIYKSIDELDSFLKRIQEKFKGKIKDMKYYIQRDQIKFTPFPEGLLE